MIKGNKYAFRVWKKIHILISCPCYWSLMVLMWQIFGVHDYTADLWAALLRPLFSTPRWIPSHSPVLVSSADMLHATNRTLQIKQTCTNNISLLLRTLNSFAIIVFLEGVAVSVSCCSMLRTSAGGHFLRPWAEETATSLASSHGTQPGCDPHFKPSSAQMESSKAEGFPPLLVSDAEMMPFSCPGLVNGQWQGGQIPIYVSKSVQWRPWIRILQKDVCRMGSYCNLHPVPWKEGGKISCNCYYLSVAACSFCV